MRVILAPPTAWSFTSVMAANGKGEGRGGTGNRAGSLLPVTTAAGSSLRDQVLVSTSQLQQQLLSAVDRLERSGSSTSGPASSPGWNSQQQTSQSHPQTSFQLPPFQRGEQAAVRCAN